MQRLADRTTFCYTLSSYMHVELCNVQLKFVSNCYLDLAVSESAGVDV
jgi:hypothetical protein